MHMLDLSTEFQNTEVSATLPESDSTTDAFPAILKIIGTNKGIISNFLKGILLKTFF